MLVFDGAVEVYDETAVINFLLLLSKLLVNFEANEEITEAEELDEAVEIEFTVDEDVAVITSTVGAFLIEFFNA